MIDHAALQSATLSNSDLSDATSCGIRASPADFAATTLTRAVRQGATLNRARGETAYGEAAVLIGATLDHATGDQSTWVDADFTGASFRNGCFTYSVFERATLVSADMRCCDFSGSDFTTADLRGAFAAEADFTDCVITPEQLALTVG